MLEQKVVTKIFLLLAAEADIKQGIAKAASDTKAWIFTSGVDMVS